MNSETNLARCARILPLALSLCLGSQIAYSALPGVSQNLTFDAHKIEYSKLDLPLLLAKPKLDLSTYVIELEAETFTLNDYIVESLGDASGGELIRLDPVAGSGSASTVFNEGTGNYFVVVYYQDENDGEGSISVEVAGNEVDAWDLTEDLGDPGPGKDAFTARRFGPINIKHGNTISVRGVREGGENARIDMLQLIPSDDLYQAENAVRNGNTSVLSSEPGFTGSGFVRLGSEYSIGSVGSVGNLSSQVTLGRTSSQFTTAKPAVQSNIGNLLYKFGPKSIEWTVNNGGAKREYAMEFRYAYGASDAAERPLDVFVNDELIKEALPFNGTGLAHRWRTQIMIATLEEGENSIRIETTGSGGADIDYLAATPVNYLNAKGDVTPESSPYAPEYGDSDYYNSYYGKVDPQGKRETLDEWLEENDFNDYPHLVESAEYINANDLGFGREMFCIDNGRSSCYVKNSLDPEGASVFAATVTMERMSNSYGSYVAFFVYDANGDRINQIALDSEGPKSVPESCYACHGGSKHGSAMFGGNYLPFDIDALKDWPGHATREQQLEDFRGLNRIMWSDANFYGNGNDNMVDLLEGWYDGAPYIGTSYDAQNLPADSWHADPNNLVNASQEAAAEAANDFLYDEVYGKYCRLCHVAQDLDWQDANAGDFARAAYEHVCTDANNAPRMPHAEVTFNKFNYDKLYTAADAEPKLQAVAGNYVINQQLAVASKGYATQEFSVEKAQLASQIDLGDLVLVSQKKTAKEMLCEVLPLSFPTGNVAAGETTYAGCQGCHRVTDATTIADYDKPDLRCKGAWLRQDMSTINSQMGFTLSMQEIADLAAYFKDFPECEL